MDRRSFVTALAGLPIVGLGARMFGLSKPAVKGGITVHGPELMDITAFHTRPTRTLSLRFENVPLRGEWNDGMGVHVSEMHSRLRPLGGVVNRLDWYWHGPARARYRDCVGDFVATLSIEKGAATYLPPGHVAFQPKSWLNIEPAGSLMFTDWGMSQQENGLCSLVCGFTPASDRPPWPGSHRPVDFQTEILKALTGRP